MIVIAFMMHWQVVSYSQPFDAMAACQGKLAIIMASSPNTVAECEAL